MTAIRRRTPESSAVRELLVRNVQVMPSAAEMESAAGQLPGRRPVRWSMFVLPEMLTELAPAVRRMLIVAEMVSVRLKPTPQPEPAFAEMEQTVRRVPGCNRASRPLPVRPWLLVATG